MTFPTVSLEVAFNYDPLASYFDSVMSLDPVAYWRMDDASGAPVDVSGNSMNMSSASGGTYSQASLLASDSNYCIDWSGSSSGCYANGGALGLETVLSPWTWGINDNPKGFTIEMLIRPDVVNVTKSLFYWDEEPFEAYVNSSGYLVFRIWDANAGSYVTATGGTALQASTTYHLMFICKLSGAVYPNTTCELTILLNGNVDGTASRSTGEYLNAAPVFSLNMYFLRLNTGLQAFNGRVDELAVYANGHINPAQAAIHYAASSATNTPTWTDLTNSTTKRGVQITTKRGRQSQKDTVEPGLMNARLRNHDRALDPTNASSAYYPNVIPMRKVRLKVVYNSTTYYVFTGDAENWKQVWSARENYLDLSVVEALSALEYNDLTNVDRPVEKAGARINKLLALSGIPSADRSVDTGSFNLQALTDGAGSVDQLITNCIEADGGIFFMTGAGVFTFHDYAHRDKYGVLLSLSNVVPPTAGFLPFIESSVETRPDRIKNQITYTKEGDTATYTTAYDANSIMKFRARTDNKTIALNSGADITTRVGQVLKDSAWPWPAPEYIIVNPEMNASLWEHVLNRDISDRLMLEIQPPGGGTPYYTQAIIEGIEHTIEPPTFWQTIWRLSKPQTLRVSETGTGTDSGVKT